MILFNIKLALFTQQGLRTADTTPALRLTDVQGNVTEFYDVKHGGGDRPIFSSRALDLPEKYGKFKSYTPAGGGGRVEAIYDSSGTQTALTIEAASSTGVERLVYADATVTNDLVDASPLEPTPPELLASVTLQQPDGSGWRGDALVHLLHGPAGLCWFSGNGTNGVAR